MSKHNANIRDLARKDAPPPSEATPSGAQLKAVLPGIILVTAIASLAICLRFIPGVALLSPMILAILIGIAWQNILGTPESVAPGIQFVVKRFLRLGIVLLGFQLTIDQLFALGGQALIVITAGLVLTFLFTVWVGRLLGVDPKLTKLVAAGTSICGASAVIAANSVTRAADEDVAYSVACVTLFGSIAMFLYPTLPEFLSLSAEEYGLWVGASIHEVAQVVAAAFQNGTVSGEQGTLAKLSRVVMLAPMVVLLGLAARGSDAGDGKLGVQVPWFVVAFIGVIGINSMISIPAHIHAGIVSLTVFLLAAALGAMGLEMRIGKLRAKGVKPLLVGLFSSIFISLLTLGIILMAGA